MYRLIQKSSTRPTRQRGLTLVELLVVIAVSAALISVAVPAYDTLAYDNRMSTEMNELVSHIHYARSEAIKRGGQVRICSANSTFTACANSGSWDSGWIVEVVGGAVLRRRLAINVADNLRDWGTPAVAGLIMFDGNGFTANARSIVLCGPGNQPEDALALIVNIVGQVRAAGDIDNDRIPEVADGTEVTCP